MHVSLNLIKCDFKATEDDVRAAYPEFTFLKVKNYHPGSFEIVLPLRIDAINFVKQSRDRYILSRRPIIKMGRNYPPSDNQDWVYVGGNSKGHGGHGYGRHNNRHGGRGDGERRQTGGREHEDRQHTETKGQEGEERKTGEKAPERKEAPKQFEPKPETQPAVNQQQKTEPKTEQKPPMRQFPESKKEEHPQEKKEYPKKERVPVVMELHDDYVPMGFGRNLPAGSGPKTTPPIVLPKTEQKPAEKPVEQKTEPKPQAPKPQEKKPETKEEPKPEPAQEKPEDDGWHVVEAKRPRKKKN